MSNLDDFKQRIASYQERSGQQSISHLFEQCNNTIFSHAAHMHPQSPPSTADIALRIKEVCVDSVSWRYIYGMLEETVQNEHQGYGVSKPVVFHYVSNMIIALLVYRRHGKTLSVDIIQRLVSKLNIQHPVLRAALEMLAEESLRRCYVPHPVLGLAG
ncbi:MAG: hypothetical protein GY881_01430 [Gammaproteobacteria bacterium]|jgi:hypothetical protein|nr:hypothetical protein [Gammaproteobacteria bacterium]MCP4878974.1 hypothetical protein [Gammaproteobacteria bacterium]MDP6164889.1 hypothetical protein [Gammaproteobacteria bacterium]